MIKGFLVSPTAYYPLAGVGTKVKGIGKTKDILVEGGSEGLREKENPCSRDRAALREFLWN